MFICVRVSLYVGVLWVACLLVVVLFCVRAYVSIGACVPCVLRVCIWCVLCVLCLFVGRSTPWFGPKQKDGSRPRRTPRARRVLSRCMYPAPFDSSCPFCVPITNKPPLPPPLHLPPPLLGVFEAFCLQLLSFC